MGIESTLQAVTVEQFGARGDATTNDQAAFAAAMTALGGPAKVLWLGAKTYVVDGALLVPSGCAILGQGPATIVKTTSNQMIFKLLSAEDVTLADFTLLGNSTGSNQNGIESGYLGGDGANRIVVDNVTAKSLGGRGFSFAYGPTPLPGPMVFGCRAVSCAGQGFGAYQQMTMIGCSATACGVGLYIGAGNVRFEGDLTANTVGVTFAVGGNDGHGSITATINHCANYGVDVGALVNGFTFLGCHIYQSPIRMVSNPGILDFMDCDIDPTSFTCDGSLARWVGCKFPRGYTNTLNSSNNPTNIIANCHTLAGVAVATLNP